MCLPAGWFREFAVNHWPELNAVDKNLVTIACALLEQYRDRIPSKEAITKATPAAARKRSTAESGQSLLRSTFCLSRCVSRSLHLEGL